MACIQSSEGLQNSGLLHPDQRGEPSPFLDRPFETTLPGNLGIFISYLFYFGFPPQVSARPSISEINSTMWLHQPQPWRHLMDKLLWESNS